MPLPATRSRLRRSRASRSGFTLLELMVIVTIVMILAGLAGPGMMRAMATNRAQRATGQLARLGRHARDQALTYGRAYVLVYNATGQGRFELWRGLNDSCRGNRWNAIVTSGACGPGQPDCTDMLDATQYSSPSHAVRIPAPATMRICFQPDGDMYTSSASTGEGNFTLATVAARVQVDRFDDGVGASTPIETRFVVFPPLAAPRIE